MNPLDLSPFLVPAVAGLEKPFSYGAYTYLTNGRLAVRRPKMADEEANNLGAFHANRINDLLDFNEEGSAPAPLRVPKERFPCHICGGSGWVIECGECGGEDEDCDYCLGAGVVAAEEGSEWATRCGNCYGVGKELRERSVLLRVSPETHLDPSVALLLHEFGVEQVQIHNQFTPGHQEWITFKLPTHHVEILGCVNTMVRFGTHLREHIDQAIAASEGLPS